MFLTRIRSFLTAVLLAMAGLGLPAGLPLPAVAADDAATAELDAALLLSGLFDVMAREGAAYGADLDRDFLGGQGGAGWAEQVRRIYDPARIGRDFRQTFAAELAATGVDPAPMTAFFTSDLGRRIVVLELSAREALLDEEVEEGARAAYERLRDGGDARVDLVRRYVDENHLIDLNVAGALNANVAFLRALGQAADAGRRMDEDEILARVWAQQDAVHAETESWMMSYAVMAYAPLGDAELQAYIDFSATEAGVALNRALFAAFDHLFVAVSAELGQALGHAMAGTSL